MCTQHHSVLRALIEEVRNLRTDLRAAEEIVDRLQRQHDDTYQYERERERQRDSDDFQRWQKVQDLRAAIERGNDSKRDRLLRRL
ncbi:MAG: hypothetical protein FJ276_36875 [Planctomycetes bacterium]|nr:hypothetical protein [Planctomycetota bacterium]